MVWALNSNNPKGTLLLAIGLLGSISYSGNIEANTLVSLTGSGYSSKYSTLEVDHTSNFTLVGSKRVSNDLVEDISVDNSLIGIKKGIGSTYTEVAVDTNFEFNRPNFYYGSVNTSVAISTSLHGKQRLLTEFNNHNLVTSNFFGSKKSFNTLDNSVNVDNNFLGYFRLLGSISSSVNVIGNFDTLSEITYVEAACIKLSTRKATVVGMTINNSCECKILLGQSVRVECTLRDFNDVLVDPTELELTIVKPTGQKEFKELPSLIKESTGNYAFSFVPDTEGTYLLQWFSTGNYQGLVEGSFFVTKGLV